MQKTSTANFQRTKSFGNGWWKILYFWQHCKYRILDLNKDMFLNNVKYKTKAKFEPKIMILLAISKYGVSTSLISQRKSCRRRRLCEIIYVASREWKFHTETSKRANNLLARPGIMQKKKQWNGLMTIKYFFFYKDINPANVSQAWPIENLWAILIQLVYKTE
jgi:hypothetical protein